MYKDDCLKKRNAEIMEMRKKGETQQSIADKYNICKDRVRQIVAKELFKIDLGTPKCSRILSARSRNAVRLLFYNKGLRAYVAIWNSMSNDDIRRHLPIKLARERDFKEIFEYRAACERFYGTTL
jgi:hypothetical protein